jgi:hypothetical protein
MSEEAISGDDTPLQTQESGAEQIAERSAFKPINIDGAEVTHIAIPLATLDRWRLECAGASYQLAAEHGRRLDAVVESIEAARSVANQ